MSENLSFSRDWAILNKSSPAWNKSISKDLADQLLLKTVPLMIKFRQFMGHHYRNGLDISVSAQIIFSWMALNFASFRSQHNLNQIFSTGLNGQTSHCDHAKLSCNGIFLAVYIQPLEMHPKVWILWKYFFIIVKIFLLYYLSTYFVFWWLYIYPATWGLLVTTSPLRLQPVTGRRARWKKSRRESCKNTFTEIQKYSLRIVKILPQMFNNILSPMPEKETTTDLLVDGAWKSQ